MKDGESEILVVQDVHMERGGEVVWKLFSLLFLWIPQRYGCSKQSQRLYCVEKPIGRAVLVITVLHAHVLCHVLEVPVVVI